MRPLRVISIVGTLLVIASAITSAGCLRARFDLCADTPPHPDCPRDAGPDAAIDAVTTDASTTDAASSDAGASDAPFAEDAATIEDAASIDDAATTDAGSDAP